MKRLIRLGIFLTLALSSVLLFCSTDLLAQPARCTPTNVAVYAIKQSDVPFVCQAAIDTLSFMMQAGIEIQDTFTIHLNEGFGKSSQQRLYLGIYEQRLKEIHILSYEYCKRFVKGECFCGLKLSRELHTSFIVHEIAHALTVNYLDNETGRIAAAEYIAYTTQLSLISDNLRQKILRHITNEGFCNEGEITSLFHDLNPSVFAVKAYKHFIRPENGKRFYNKLITGQAILDRED